MTAEVVRFDRGWRERTTVEPCEKADIDACVREGHYLHKWPGVVWHLDLFSGIGGFALAANWAGYTTVGFCEIDEYCQRVLRKHWPDVPVWGDVRELTGADIRGSTDHTVRVRRAGHADTVRAGRDTATNAGTVGLITAGYPCQPFSLAGKRLGAEDDRHLWPEVKRLLAELRPARFLGENVAGHINMGLDDVLSDLEEIGYTARPVVIPACAVNAPHRRDRVWIMGYANEPGSQGHGQHGERAGERVARASGPDARALSDRIGAVAGNGAPPVVDTTGGGGADHARGGTQGANRCAQQRMGESHDGLPGRLADPRWGGDPMNAFGPDWEDGVPRVVATEQDRVHRLKALGNAIVPQVAYQILLAMNEKGQPR
jgi:DNA (cytosine-5)-methyltransferase 1